MAFVIGHEFLSQNNAPDDVHFFRPARVALYNLSRFEMEQVGGVTTIIQYHALDDADDVEKECREVQCILSTQWQQ